ncbi:MAG: flavodoxin family protein [Lachnospiraceae bacterium]|nr:flavodoxin family protein [Lachnospiraceae bacterium]
MKTLILNGSPRPKGDTASLIKIITDSLKGEYKIVNAYRCHISPCIDCRYCWENDGCAIKDEMQEVYDYIQECDNVLIASPVYFAELTGKMLDLGSRLQTYSSAKLFRKEEAVKKAKRGAVLLAGGGSGGVERAYETARMLLHCVNCRDIHEVVSCRNTDKVPGIEDREALDGVKKIIAFFEENR